MLLWHNDFHETTKYPNRATKVSVTAKAKDPIPHGLEGYRKYGCDCDDGTAKSCKGANRLYHREQRARRSQARTEMDELAAKRVGKSKPKTDPNGSVRGRRIGEMEKAVIAECAAITDAKPTLVVAAKNLGRSVDDLTGNPKVIALYNSTMKQLMATMAELRGDKDKASTAGRKKSGGRLATVGNLTKVKRAQ